MKAPDIKPGDNSRCPECNVLSPDSEWIETEAYCEDCGSHPAMRCPKCDEVFDTIYVTLETK